MNIKSTTYSPTTTDATPLCGEHGNFSEECYLDHVSNKPIDKVEDVENILGRLDNILSFDSSLNSISNISQVSTIIKKIHNFLQNNEVGAPITKNLTNSTVQIFSQTFDQAIAWNNGTDREKAVAASDILSQIQTNSYILNCYLNEENKTFDFSSDNLYEKMFYNFTEKIDFEYKFSLISVPNVSYFEDIEEELMSCKKDSSLGAVIKKLNDYMIHRLNENQRMNTELISFSIRNTNKTNYLRDGQNVKIR